MEAAIFQALLAAGIPALAYALGALATSRLGDNGETLAVVRVALAIVVGVAALTPLLIAAAAFGALRLAWLGTAGWLLVAAILWRRRDSWRRRRPHVAETVVLVAAVVFVAVAIDGRDETLGAGRDQQVYAEFAIALARGGAPLVRYPTADAADRALLAQGYTRAACHAGFFDRWQRQPLATTPFVVPGGTNACDGVVDPIVLLHPWGWPVWLAVAGKLFGIGGVYSANAVVFAVGAMLFFGVARLFVGPLAATTAALVLLTLPSSLWIAGISLSEPLAMMLLFAIPLLGAVGTRTGDALVALATLAAILVRIDAAIVVPIVTLAMLLAAIAQPSHLPRARRLAGYQCLALAVATGFYIALVPSYLDALWTPYVSVLGASLALLVLSIAITRGGAERARAFVAAGATARTSIASLVVLFVYAALVRPRFAPTAAPSGAHDFREYSLVNLAANLSWPLVIVALAGISHALWTGWHRRSELRYPLALLLALGSTILLLAFPGVSADQPWGFRRFVPLVVPYAVLFAVVALQGMRVHARRLRMRAAFAVVVAAMIVAVALLPRAFARLQENAGYTAALASIANALPATLTVASGPLQDVAAALFVGYDKPVAASSRGLNGENGAITDWIAARLGEGGHAWLLHDATFDDAGLVLSHRQSWTLRRAFVVPQPRAPATHTAAETSVVTLSRVDGFDANFATQMFGGEPVWGSRERGFHAPETADFGTFRYTDGNAWIDVPSASLQECDALKVDLLAYARAPARRHVSITADGNVLWTGFVDAGIATLRVPLAIEMGRPTVRIGIVSDVVDPGDMGANDRRRIGVGLIGIRALRSGEPHEAGAGMEGFDAAIAIAGSVRDPIVITAGGRGQVTMTIRNAGSAYWPAYREHEAPVGVVKIALSWTHHGKRDVPAATGRWPLAVSMLGGDRLQLRVPVAPPAPDGKPLPAGDYDVQVRMVREGVGYFPDTPVGTVTLRVRIEPASSNMQPALAYR